MTTTKIVVLEDYKEEVRPEVVAANAFQITDAESMQAGVDLMSRLGKGVDMIEGYELKKMGAWKLKIKTITAEVAPMKKSVKAAYQIMRDKVAAYQMKAEEETAAAKAKLAENMMKGQLKPETASAKAALIVAPEATVESAAGSVSFIVTKKLLVTDITAIPAMFMVVDESKLLAALKGGMKVPGAEIKEVKTVRSSR